jgi:hypothetical protein
MDMTVEVMLPPRGSGFGFELERNGRYMVLMPVAVYSRRNLAVVNMPHTGYIHVTGVPDRISVQKANQVLCQLHEQELLIGEEPLTQIIERRKWRADATTMPAALRNQFLANRQITVTFTQFRNAMKNLIEANRNLTEEDFD